MVWVDTERESWICNAQVGHLSTIFLILGGAKRDLLIVVDIDRALAMGVTARDDHINRSVAIDIRKGDLSSTFWQKSTHSKTESCILVVHVDHIAVLLLSSIVASQKEVYFSVV